jgi:CelD/BcsL family acetyltransferase involved in cellulose biosynthesis
MTAIDGYRAVNPRSGPEWDELMDGPDGSVFGAPPWISTIVDTYGFDVTAGVLVDAAGRPAAGLACAEISDFRGDRLVSLPFCDYLDPVAGNQDEWNALAAPLFARALPFQLRVLRSGPPRDDPRLERAGELAWHGTDLDRDEDELFAGLRPGARQHVRSARRRGVSVRFGTELEDIRAFYDLHRRTRKRKYHLLAQPLSFFENMWKSFAPIDGIAVGLAIHDDDVIAASLYLMWRGVMYYKFGASNAERLGLRPNEMLAWESMRLGRERGCRKYDWGVSDLDQPGLVAYKRKFATEERRVTVLRHTPAGYANPNGADAAHTLGELTRLFTRDDVPDEVTEQAGEVLYRFFT